MSIQHRVLLLILISILGYGQVTWEREVIDSTIDASYFGRFNSLALDTNGIPGVVYNDDAIHTIFYAFQSAGSWYREVVDSGFFVAHGYSLIYDNYNTPHMSYYRVNTQTSQNTYFCHASRDSIGWQISVIETIPHRFQGLTEIKTSIAVDTVGLPNIAYVAHDSIELQYIKYAHHNGITWDTSVVEYHAQLNCRDWGPSLRFDKYNTPHIAFYQSGNITNTDTLKYYTYDSLNNWIIKWAKFLYGEGAPSLELVLDDNQYPHIAYDEGAALAYSWWDGFSWQTDYITGIGWVGIRISLALDANDRPHIAYHPDMQVMTLYCYKDGSWHLTGPIDSAGTNTGFDIDLEINKNNIIHAVYPSSQYGVYNGTIKHAWRDLVGIEELTSKITDLGICLQVPTFPRDGCLTCSYYVTSGGEIELSIYDITGARVERIRRKIASPGYYQEKIRVERFTSGVYLIVFKQNARQISKEFLLIK